MRQQLVYRFELVPPYRLAEHYRCIQRKTAAAHKKIHHFVYIHLAIGVQADFGGAGEPAAAFAVARLPVDQAGLRLVAVGIGPSGLIGSGLCMLVFRQHDAGVRVLLLRFVGHQPQQQQAQ